jgi:hypothetical protein
MVGDSAHFRNSRAVPLCFEKLLIAQLWPPRLDLPGKPAMPSASAFFAVNELLPVFVSV